MHVSSRRHGYVGWIAIAGILLCYPGLAARAEAQGGPPAGEPTHQEILRQLTILQGQLAEMPKQNPRTFYLTKDEFTGGQAKNACDAGYHFASMWEVFQTSSLKYDTERGAAEADSGSGPPAGGGSLDFVGWIRTGGPSSSERRAGNANCNAWTTSELGGRGTVAGLTNDWPVFTADAPEPIVSWFAQHISCVNTLKVWCVAD